MVFRADSLQVDSQAATVGGYRLLNNQPAINGDTVPILPGMPVIVVGDDIVKRASAASQALAGVDGIAFGDPADPTMSLLFRSGGRINLMPAQWDLITGESGGLFPGAIYWLGLSPGTLTSSPPFDVGQSVCIVGKAFTPGSLIVELGVPLLL